MTEPIVGPPHCRRCGRVVAGYVVGEDGLCPGCRHDTRESAAAIEEAAPPAPLSVLDRRILSTLGSRMGVYMDRPSPWVPSIARSLSWIANRSDLAAVYVIGRLLDLADRGLVVTREGDGGVRLWRLTEAGCAALGTAHAAPTGSAREKPAEGAALMPIGDDLVDQTALLLGVDRFPPGPLRSAAVVGAAIASGYPADVIAALAAVAVEQLGAALEERGQTAARLARRGEDRSAALGRAAADALDAGSEVFGGSPPPAAPATADAGGLHAPWSTRRGR